MKYKNGSDFLNKLYSNMHMDDVVMHTATKTDTPDEKITKYLDRLERVHNVAKDNESKMDLLKKFYYDKYVIKELPESYVNLQKKIAREEGHGNIEVTQRMREKLLEYIQADQKKSLDSWIEYLSSDDAMYPMWFKNYAFQGMIKLSDFDKEKSSFGTRTYKTVNPYIELNREVLALCYNVLAKEVENKELTDEQTRALENGISFKKLYTYYLTKQNYTKDKNKSNEGIWVKYEQGSDSTKLCDTLQGKNTGWCTAGYETAKTQLDNGDFYIYYTKDNEGDYTEPRIAIRMKGHDKIGEVRGVAQEQNLESEMTDIAEKKLDEFADKEKYKKKVHDMKLLTEIEKKTNLNQDLTENDLKFLYEVDSEIVGFGWNKDPRVEEIRSKRNKKRDLALIYNCSESNIALDYNDFVDNDIVVFYGDFQYSDFSSKLDKSRLKNLKHIIGNADFDNLTDARGLESLTSIGGYAKFESLTDSRGLENLTSIGWYAKFDSLTDARGLESLTSIGGEANFESLTDSRGLENLTSIGWYAKFDSLTDARGLESLTSIGWIAYFNSLTDATGLESLTSIGESAYFNSITDARGLENLRSINGKKVTFEQIKERYVSNKNTK